MSVYKPSPQCLLYYVQDVQNLDRLTIAGEQAGIVLMKRAGQAVFSVIRRNWPKATGVAIFCGPGNNGGDGYIIAGLAAQAGLIVSLFETPTSTSRSLDAERARRFALDQGVKPESSHLFSGSVEIGTIIVDAILGIGFQELMREEICTLVGRINNAAFSSSSADLENLEAPKEAKPPIIAVDIPSGLNANTGAPSPTAIVADKTVTFIGRKFGQFTGRGRDFCGEVLFESLGVTQAIYDQVTPKAEVLRVEHELMALPQRQKSSHKGSNGHVLVIGGARGMGGAALMAATSAMRVGAGLVSVATDASHVSAYLDRQPELMVRGWDSTQDVEVLLQKATVIALGPGLGTTPSALSLLHLALESRKPLVLDADALNLIAEVSIEADALCSEFVMTPHPGEAARLLNLKTSEVEADRITAINGLQEKYGGVQILKGAGTLISGQNQDPKLALCSDGNPGMASGGMGDVLTGTIAGLMAQSLPVLTAARLGVCVHAAAADRLAEASGQRGLLATDLIPVIRDIVNGK